MTNTEIIQAIRNEIIRLKGQLIRGACSAQIEMETNCKERAYDEVLSFLSTLESEKPNQDELEKEIGSYMSNKWKFGCVIPITPVVLPNFTTENLKECARHFAQWGAEHLKK